MLGRGVVISICREIRGYDDAFGEWSSQRHSRLRDKYHGVNNTKGSLQHLKKIFLGFILQ